MKTITLNSTTKMALSKGLILLLSLFAVGTSFAQLQNNGTLYVRDNGILSLKTGQYGFGTGSARTETTKTSGTNGKLVFGSATTFVDATPTHSINGYARTLSADPFTLFLGEPNVLAPIRVDPFDSSGIEAAFFLGLPTNNGSIASGITEISTNEYWNVKSTTNTAVLSLSYRPATIDNLTTSLYTIVGYRTSTSQWEIIPSTVEPLSFVNNLSSTASAGSIKSDGAVDFTVYQFFTIGSKGDLCQPVFVATGPAKRWTGTIWVLDSNDSPTGAPDATNPVIIAGAYPATEGSFTCNTLLLNANVSLAIGQSIDCVNEATGVGVITLASEANFVQRNNASAAPSIVLNKRTRTNMRRYDYVYFGTPIAGNFLSQIGNAQSGENATFQANSATPLTPYLIGAFDNLLKYVSGQAATTSGWQPLDATTTGRGFIARVKQQAPFTNLTNTDFINLKFTGTANNGTIGIGITNNTLAPFSGASHNLLANPYPSAIDADKFLLANTDVDGVVYIWTAASSYIGTGSYSQADYITYTRLGATAATPTIGPGEQPFNGKIASGQGFKVRSLTNAGTATFNNCMRLTTDNNQFYRSSSEAARDRYKITMTGANGVYSQVLVGYTPETTLAYDRMYDATRNSVSTAQVYTLLDNTTRRLAINARPSFVNTDKVALGILKNNTNAETFVFSISEKEGVFADDVTVYLHDKVLNTYHNFNNGSFTYTSNVTNLGTRFDLVYVTDSQLDNPDFNVQNTLVSLNESIFKVSSTGVMSSIVIYDIAGRLINTYSNIDSTTFTSNFTNVQGVYIAKIKLADGTIVTEKVINQ